LYDGSLLHPYPEWEALVDFNYHGWNSYASFLAKYGVTYLGNSEKVDTYDIVQI
jgi:hypothetical protein